MTDINRPLCFAGVIAYRAVIAVPLLQAPQENLNLNLNLSWYFVFNIITD